MLKQHSLMGFQNENWRHLQIFYIAILCEAVQVCSEFSFVQEAALLGITLPAAAPCQAPNCLCLEALKWFHQSQGS